MHAVNDLLALIRLATSTDSISAPNQAYTVYKPPTLCSFLGIGSGHRLLIAATCIAEHA